MDIRVIDVKNATAEEFIRVVKELNAIGQKTVVVADNQEDNQDIQWVSYKEFALRCGLAPAPKRTASNYDELNKMNNVARKHIKDYCKIKGDGRGKEKGLEFDKRDSDKAAKIIARVLKGGRIKKGEIEELLKSI